MRRFLCIAVQLPFIVVSPLFFILGFLTASWWTGFDAGQKLAELFAAEEEEKSGW